MNEIPELSDRLNWNAGAKHLTNRGVPEDRARVLIKFVQNILECGKRATEIARLTAPEVHDFATNANLDGWRNAVELLERKSPGLPRALGLTLEGEFLQ